MDENRDIPMVPQYQAESTIMHMGYANRRMLIALICVCVTFVITILVFTKGYTEREKNWLDALERIRQTPITEVHNGVQQYPDAAADP